MTSLYNYQNEAKIWLPMTAETHDPGNLRTLDVSGNGLHYKFGDGATSTTYPTKLSKRGYSFDGSTDYLEAEVNQTNAITTATWAIFLKSTFVDADLVSHWDGVNVRCLLSCFGAGLSFFCGDIVNPATFTVADIAKNQSLLIAGRVTSDGYRRLYVGGLTGTANNTGSAVPSVSVSTKPRIGIRYSGTRPLNGSVFWFGHWEYALSELQLRDLEARLRRQLNDV